VCSLREVGTVLCKSTVIPVFGLKKYRGTGTRYFDQKVSWSFRRYTFLKKCKITFSEKMNVGDIITKFFVN